MSACPWLESASIELLDEIVPELERAGLLAIVDGAGLPLMADRYTEVLAWRELVRTEGLKRAHALGHVSALRRAEDSFRKWGAEYGLTALSRTRLAERDNSLGKDDESDLDAT